MEVTEKAPYLYQTQPHVCNLAARNSGAGNGCANFVGTWDVFFIFLLENPLPIKLLVLQGGILGFCGEGGV